jgi:ribosomal subunit interface protein
VDIIFKALHTDVREPFRKHATVKLARLGKLDGKAIRIDVQLTAEPGVRAADRRERVELTVTSRGPAIRAEAAAEDRFTAFDQAFTKLESRLRRACDRRKGRHGAHAAIRLTDLPEADLASDAERPAIRLGRGGGLLAGNGAQAIAAIAAAADAADAADAAAAEGEPPGDETREVPVEMQGEGPLVIREKFHAAAPMGIDEALFEMELVGHDFFLFTDATSGLPSVVYRRRGYQYGVLRLLEEHAAGSAEQPGSQPGQAHPQSGNSANGAAPSARTANQASTASQPGQASRIRRAGGQPAADPE